jgi:signal transduction histidine kinase
VIRARLLALVAAVELGAAIGFPLLLERLLLAPDEVTRAVAQGGWARGALAFAAAAALTARRFERRRVLELPGRLAGVVLLVHALALAVDGARLTAMGAAIPVVIGVELCGAALAALVPVPIYAFARLALLRSAVELGDPRNAQSIEGGRRLSLALQLGYSIAAIGSAALVPAAVFGAARLDVAAAADARDRAALTGARLAVAAEPLDVAAATTLVTHTPLSAGERTLLRAPSGTLLPEEAAQELADRPYVELPLKGALLGGALRVTYSPPLSARKPLLVVAMLLLVLAVALAIFVGGAVARDLDRVTHQIDRVARNQEPDPAGDPLTVREVKHVARATSRLLERIPRITVESYLAIERANEAQRMKSQFLANMSHDLRSPLNSILGFSELLLRGIEGQIAPGQEVALAAIQARGLHILRLLNEILDTAKVESGKMELHRQRTAPAEMLRQAVQDARRGRPHLTGDRLAVALQPGLQPIFCDPLRLTQAVMHLLNYGLDTSADGHVVLRASEQEGKFVLELEHDGALSPEDLRELFDGFRKSTRGAGLNLALPLARRLVELHGGAFEVASPRPPRLRATLPLPRHRA